MYNLNYSVSNDYFDRDDFCWPCVNTDDPCCSRFISTDVVNVGFYTSSKYLCDWSVQAVNSEAILEFCEANFLQLYVTKCGCRLTKSFLSVVNGHKSEFIEKVDSILVELILSFDHLKCLDDNHTNKIELMSKICSSFSRCAYDLRYRCIDILRHDIIPLTIRNIFDSNVVDGDYERKMTYPEMEQLFLYFFSTLEKLVEVKIIKYWNDFCAENKSLLSSIIDIDYSNPFICAYHFDGIGIHDITHPAAFSNKFSVYISFMAIAVIDKMIDIFVRKCDDVLKEVVHYKCSYICNYSSNIDCDLRRLGNELSDKFKILIEKEFNEKVVNERFKDSISNFLNVLVIWRENESVEIDRALIVDNIIDYMKNMLMDRSNNNVSDVVMSFRGLKVRCGKRFSSDWKCKFGFKIHPEDSSKILSIRSKFADKSRAIVKNKFYEMIKEEYKFSDGTTVGIVGWDEISENMFPVAQETIRCFVEAERKELLELLSNIRIFDDGSIFDGSSYGTRSATSEEMDKIFKHSVENIYNCSRDLFSKVWKNLINSEKVGVLRSMGYGGQLNGECSPGAPSYAVQSNTTGFYSIPVELAEKNCSVFSILGLNILPEDYNLILGIRRKFSVKIRSNVAKILSDTLRNRIIFPSGGVIRCSRRCYIYGELFDMAVELFGFIVEGESEELGRILSTLHVADINSGNYVFRMTTDHERENFITRSRKIAYARLKSQIRSLWAKVFDKVKYCGRDEDCEIGGVCTLLDKIKCKCNTGIVNFNNKCMGVIRSEIFNKFSEMIKNKYEFDDGTTVSNNSSWFEVGDKLNPVASDYVKRIMESEVDELKAIVNISYVVIDFKVIRKLTDRENYVISSDVMYYIYTASKKLFEVIWGNVIDSLAVESIGVDCCLEIGNSDDKCSFVKLSSIGFRDLIDVDKSKFDNVRLEFLGVLGPMVNEVIDSLALNRDLSLTCIGDVSSCVFDIVSRRSHHLLKELCFLDKAESLLLTAQVVMGCGDSRFITDVESKFILKEFMDSIDHDIDCLVKKRINKFKDLFFFNDAENDVGRCKYHYDLKLDIVADAVKSVFYDHSYAKKQC
ncbi:MULTISPECIES: hypothetical protein [Candidatus Ichthyocystis]|uniref:Uncharacterized protein n=1 Tax=Candidatus Ichthyocystis hellenicum TaxID=1561003 RepID=A0A0S4M1P3_9BURK|nr:MULTISPECIES: hypothetical protein [Ichthyocystis]CUT17689.1 hypothetical protein Ark11_0866 [Candidatus Ichthyocystis hellenicum]